MLERYEGAMYRHADKEKEYGSLRVRGPIGWLKKKSGDKPPKEKKASSFLGKYRYTKVKPSESTTSLMPIPEDNTPPPPTLSASSAKVEDEKPVTPAHRARMTQQRLQEQIQLLRTLCQHQQDSLKGPDNHYNTVEFTTTATPLAKSISMPSIIRGISVANFNKHKS